MQKIRVVLSTFYEKAIFNAKPLTFSLMHYLQKRSFILTSVWAMSSTSCILVTCKSKTALDVIQFADPLKFDVLRNLWVARSNHALVLLFISLVEFYKCIFWANVTDFEIFKTVLIIMF